VGAGWVLELHANSELAIRAIQWFVDAAKWGSGLPANSSTVRCIWSRLVVRVSSGLASTVWVYRRLSGPLVRAMSALHGSCTACSCKRPCVTLHSRCCNERPVGMRKIRSVPHKQVSSMPREQAGRGLLQARARDDMIPPQRLRQGFQSR
jgi:hypothetical protein